MYAFRRAMGDKILEAYDEDTAQQGLAHGRTATLVTSIL
jgi:hypothetical protein